MFIYHFNRLIRSRLLWGFFAIIIAFAIWVFWCFFKNINVLKVQEAH